MMNCVLKTRNFVSKTRNFVSKTRKCVSKTRNCVLKMMNLSGPALPLPAAHHRGAPGATDLVFQRPHPDCVTPGRGDGTAGALLRNADFILKHDDYMLKHDELIVYTMQVRLFALVRIPGLFMQVLATVLQKFQGEYRCSY